MTLNQTKETILRWIDSCETAEQLALCLDAVNEFIISRFKMTTSYDEYMGAANECIDLIAARKMAIIQHNIWNKQTSLN